MMNLLQYVRECNVPAEFETDRQELINSIVECMQTDPSPRAYYYDTEMYFNCMMQYNLMCHNIYKHRYETTIPPTRS
jgi:hypothetical protein